MPFFDTLVNPCHDFLPRIPPIANRNLEWFNPDWIFGKLGNARLEGHFWKFFFLGSSIFIQMAFDLKNIYRISNEYRVERKYWKKKKCFLTVHTTLAKIHTFRRTAFCFPNVGKTQQSILNDRNQTRDQILAVARVNSSSICYYRID